jgi:hypothetical protein
MLDLDTFRDNDILFYTCWEDIVPDEYRDSRRNMESLKDTDETIFIFEYFHDCEDIIVSRFSGETGEEIRETEVAEYPFTRDTGEHDLSSDLRETCDHPIEDIIDELAANNRMVYTLFLDQDRRK